MSFEVTPLRGVRQQYGARDTGYAIGVVKTEGVSNELTVDVSGESLNANAYAQVVVPAGAIITAAYYETTEAFDLGGTTPTINIGTLTSSASNGVEVTNAQAEATGADDITAALQGTWAAGSALAAATTVEVTMGGTSPTAVSGVGKLTVTIVYKKL